MHADTPTCEGYIPLPEGNIYYCQYGNSKEKAPLILAHGGPGFCHDALQVLALLAEERTLIFYDQLGCGKSDHPNNNDLWTLERYIKELEHIVNFFEFNQYYLLGHSFGGSLVLDYALTAPAGLKGLILSSPLISTEDWIADTNLLKQQLPKEVQEKIDSNELSGNTDSEEYKEATQIFYQHFLCRLQPKPDIYVNALKKYNYQIYNTMWGPSEFHCTGNLKNYNRKRELTTLNYPTLLLCGKYDEARPETMKKYCALLPQGSLHVFNNSAHVSFMEETENYLKVVSSFLNQVDKIR